jgi:hypothetical protein
LHRPAASELSRLAFEIFLSSLQPSFQQLLGTRSIHRQIPRWEPAIKDTSLWTSSAAEILDAPFNASLVVSLAEKSSGTLF